MDIEESDMFLPLRLADLRPFNMESAEKDLGIKDSKETKRGARKEGPSWIWQRWNVINTAKTPRLKDMFVEGVHMFCAISL